MAGRRRRKAASARPTRRGSSAPAVSPTPRSFAEWLRSLPRVARAVTGAVGFAATVIGLLFVLWPSLKPDEPPVEKGAKLSNAQIEPAVTFGAYLDRIEQSRAPYGPADLRRRGAFVEFDITVRGYKNKPLPLRWQLVDARSGDQLGHSRDLRFKPKVDTDAGSWSFWIPIPRRARRMYVQIQLYNDAGTVPIGRVRTAEFERVQT
jgi:hypothetical protein